jgi:hypothetical protein
VDDSSLHELASSVGVYRNRNRRTLASRRDTSPSPRQLATGVSLQDGGEVELSMSNDAPAFDADVRAQMKHWLDTWKRVGPLLEQERWDRVVALTDAEAQQAAIRLFALWRPDWPTDGGEGLLLHQRVFARARQGG